ncbi:hypothetical protein IAT38_006054 [Cryptococcus sp. DSM 104549]
MPDEDDLFARFAALRAPQTPLPEPIPAEPKPKSYQAVIDEQARKAREEEDEMERIANGMPVTPKTRGAGALGAAGEEGGGEEVDFAKGIARLKGVEPAETDDQYDEDQDIEAFLRSIASSAPPPPSDPLTNETDVQAISRAMALVDFARVRERSRGEGGGDGGSEDGGGSDEEGDEEESEEAIIARALDEARLEEPDEDEPEPPATTVHPLSHDSPSPQPTSKSPVPPLLPPAPSNPASQAPADPADPITLSFPSLPTHIPTDPNPDTPDTDIDADTQRRLQLLMGLTPSPAKPGEACGKPNASSSSGFPAPPKTAPKFDLPGYTAARDDDTESWCCICNRDAALVCIGCDDDLYCEECWQDGHGVGEGKERGHRVKRFVWGNRRAMGAA